MEINEQDRLLSRDIKKIKRQHKDNIFSTTLNYNLTKYIMDFLDIKNLYEFAKTCIFIFNSFIDYENTLIFEKIKKNIENKICTFILENGRKGIGYFCTIHFSLYKLMNVLITDNHLIDESFLKNENNIIKLFMNHNQIYREIYLNNRIKYTNKEYNITIIQIFQEDDKINDFLELDYRLLNINGKEIYILNNTNNKKYVIFGGKVLKNNFYDFNYICQANIISPGTPILNILNNKIIGIHKGFDKNTNCNMGFFFNYFLQTFTFEEQDKQTIFLYSSGKLKCIRRMQNELNFYNNKEMCDNYVIYPITENLIFLQAIVFGPEDTPYENGVFFLDITLPLEYPFRPPMIKFKTKIFHPNFIINEDCRYAVKELSKDWNPGITISKIVNKIYSLLKKPNMDCENAPQNILHFHHHHHSIKKNIFNKECLEIMKENYENYKKIAKEWTIKFAQK